MFESKQNISPSPRLSKPANSESANSANSANSATEATEAPSFPHARTHYFASVSPRCCFLINPSIRNPTNDGGVALSNTDSHMLPPSTLRCSRPEHDPACPRRYTCPTRRKLQCRTQAQQQAAQPTQRLTARQHLPSHEPQTTSHEPSPNARELGCGRPPHRPQPSSLALGSD